MLLLIVIMVRCCDEEVACYAAGANDLGSFSSSNIVHIVKI